ncbi:hypothetical protein VF21_05448 [Pseudogymnoascus sp. 05NY08]|nr:hypothetical protein VF21_05448 [Pseudogymnoascus sp. 05NY08]
MPYFGRRKIYMSGAFTMSAILFIIRILGTKGNVMAKTICLARNAYYIADVVGGVLQPYFMNPTEWNLKGYTGFIWGSTCFILAVVSTVLRFEFFMANICSQWAYFRLPETKGRTFDELATNITGGALHKEKNSINL